MRIRFFITWMFALWVQHKQRKTCAHEEVFETRACDAICRDCGKNLGFIQNWRDQRKAKK